MANYFRLTVQNSLGGTYNDSLHYYAVTAAYNKYIKYTVFSVFLKNTVKYPFHATCPPVCVCV